jgi:hypothetical protein
MDKSRLSNGWFLPTPVSERFWSKVDKSGDCWTWTASHRADGYGLVSVNGRFERAHRVALALTGIDVPEKMEVCHRCDNPSCVRPDHLFIGTHAENMRDMMSKDRFSWPQRQIYCLRGIHLLAKSAKIDVRGERYCYPCKLEHDRISKAKRKRSPLL